MRESLWAWVPSAPPRNDSRREHNDTRLLEPRRVFTGRATLDHARDPHRLEREAPRQSRTLGTREWGLALRRELFGSTGSSRPATLAESRPGIGFPSCRGGRRSLWRNYRAGRLSLETAGTHGDQ